MVLVAVSEWLLGIALVITVPRMAHGTGTADDDSGGEGGASAEGAAVGGAGEGIGCVVAIRGSSLMEMSSPTEAKFRRGKCGKLTM